MIPLYYSIFLTIILVGQHLLGFTIRRHYVFYRNIVLIYLCDHTFTYCRSICSYQKTDYAETLCVSVHHILYPSLFVRLFWISPNTAFYFAFKCIAADQVFKKNIHNILFPVFIYNELPAVLSAGASDFKSYRSFNERTEPKHLQYNPVTCSSLFYQFSDTSVIKTSYK